MPVTLLWLALGAFSWRSHRDPVLFLLVMLSTAALFMTTPYVGYLDNITVLYFLSLILAFFVPGRTSWGARTALFLVGIAAAFTHPTTCVIFGFSLMAVFGLRVLTDAELREFPLIIHSAGYPAVKPRGTQWVDASRIGDFDDQHIYYRLDTWGGNSGAPIFASFSDGQRQVVASHSHGTADRTSNAGVRITDAIFDVIEGWIG